MVYIIATNLFVLLLVTGAFAGLYNDKREHAKSLVIFGIFIFLNALLLVVNVDEYARSFVGLEPNECVIDDAALL